MKKKELSESLLFLENYHLLSTELCDELSYHYKTYRKYDAIYDSRFSDYFKKGSGIAKDRDMWFNRAIAFTVVSELSACEFGLMSLQDLDRAYEICGYTPLEMEEYALNSGLDMDVVINDYMRPNVIILTRLLSEAMQENINGDTSKKAYRRFSKTVEYMRNICMLSARETSITSMTYKTFIIQTASNFLKNEILYYEEDDILRHISKLERKENQKTFETVIDAFNKSELLVINNKSKLGVFNENILKQNIANSIFEVNDRIKAINNLNFILDKCPLNLKSIVNQIISRKKYWENITQVIEDLKEDKIRENNKEFIEMFKMVEMADIAISAFNNLIDDEIFPLHIGVLIWQKFISCSGFPSKTLMTYGGLEDDGIWNIELGDELKKLGEEIYNSKEFITVPFRDTNNRVDTSLTAPLSSIVANYANHLVLDQLFVRDTIINLFKNAGCSERKSRDLAVVISTLEMVNYLETMGDTVPPKTIGRYLDEKEKKIISASDENLHNIIGQLQTENESLRGNLYKEKKYNQCNIHKINLLQREIEELEISLKEKENSIQEKDNYELDNSNISKNDITEEIEFPIDLGCKIVVVGGFDSFHEKLKMFLPNIKTIEVTEHIDLEPVRNADFVFYQTNKTDHSSYWYVRGACKNAGVPFYHLKYSGAERCAEEIVYEVNRKTE